MIAADQGTAAELDETQDTRSDSDVLRTIDANLAELVQHFRLIIAGLSSFPFPGKNPFKR